MCAIVGALLGNVGKQDLDHVNTILNHIILASQERGRDGWGLHISIDNSVERPYKAIPQSLTPFDRKKTLRPLPQTLFDAPFNTACVIMNLRAEPTTEFVKQKREHDQQPYSVRPFHVVHNGTIANDKALRTWKLQTTIDSAAIPEVLNTWLAEEHMSEMEPSERLTQFCGGIGALQGSWAILAARFATSNEIYIAANYRPVWVITTKFGWFFASSKAYFPEGHVPEMLTPYSQHLFYIDGSRGNHLKALDEHNRPANRKALVVCSGGLDSTVAATVLLRQGYEVRLIHFRYGSRAEGPEVRAVEAIAKRLGVDYTIFPLPVYHPKDSPLLRADSAIAGGEEGAEFAHEWVPARNLLLLSVATAYAEANGFGIIALGNNLEEAGAYPDNEPEFVNRFNDILPFAIGANKSVRVVMPVGNLMKHEIVKLGLEAGAPMDLTWSCYRAGEQHCGTCGPCYMRRVAFEINDEPEVIHYANEESA